MSLFGKSKESIPAEQPSTAKEGIDLSEQEKQEIIQRITEIDQRIEAIKAIRTDEEQWNKLEDNKAQALFDEYNTIKNEKERLQRKLEGKTSEIIITAETKEGKEIEFNLEQIKAYWVEFFNQHNLKEIAEELEQAEIQLTAEQIETIKEKAKQGFNRLMFMPKTETSQTQLQNIKEQTEKPIQGLKDEQQYRKSPDSEGQKGIWLSDTVKPNFPDKIQTNNRPENKAYLLFLKDNLEADDNTRNKTPEKLRQEFQKKQETGLTLEEYLIFQRDYTQRHVEEDKPHPDTQHVTWLLDSELDPQSSEPGRVLRADWLSGHRRVLVNSHPASDSYSSIGARSSAIFEIL